MTTKNCTTCNLNKVRSGFHKGKQICKACEGEKLTYEKKCHNCNKMKKSTEFYKGENSCRKCRYERKKSNLKNCIACKLDLTKNNFRRGQQVCNACENNKDIVYDKFCKECKTTKSNTSFRKNRRMCLDCERSLGREYRRVTTKSKEWTEKNPTKMKELQKNWYQKNKQQIRKNDATRCATDSDYLEVKNYKSTIPKLIKGVTKSNKKLQISRDIFVRWLTFCFKDEMTIENYGSSWQIDHVIPLYLMYGKQKNDEQLNKYSNLKEMLFIWFNLRPVTFKKNRNKSNMIDEKTCMKHVRQLRKFFRNNNDIILNDKFYIYRQFVHNIVFDNKL